MTVRIGVLGCADIAVRRMLPAMTTTPGVSLAAVASRDPAKAARVAEAFRCRPVHGYAELLRSDTVDAVYVPLPAALHAAWVERALTAGKHVLAEKPLTTDPAETRALFYLARARGLVLMENVMFVHHGQHRAVARLLADGAIGDIRSMHATFAVPRRDPGDIRYSSALGGGALFDTGVYPVRAAVHLLGPDLAVAGAVLRNFGGVDVSGSALLRTPGGAAAHVTFGLDNAYESRYEIRGSEGSITVDRAFTPPADHVPTVRLGADPVHLPAEDQVANTLIVFAGAIRRGDLSDNGSIRQAELIAAIRASGDPEARRGESD